MGPEQLSKIISIVHSIADKLVDDAGSLQVFLRPDGVTIQVLVGERDLGKLIGKAGKTSHSLRTLIDAMTMQTGGRDVRLRLDLGVLPRSAAAE